MWQKKKGKRSIAYRNKAQWVSKKGNIYSPIVNYYDPKLFGTDCDGRFIIQLSIADHSYRLSKISGKTRDSNIAVNGVLN